MANDSLERAKHCPPAPRAKKHKSRLFEDGQEHQTKPDEHIRKVAEKVNSKQGFDRSRGSPWCPSKRLIDAIEAFRSKFGNMPLKGKVDSRYHYWNAVVDLGLQHMRDLEKLDGCFDFLVTDIYTASTLLAAEEQQGNSTSLEAQVLRIRQWERKREAEWVLAKALEMHCKLDRLLKACSELVEEHEEQRKLPRISVLACQKEELPPEDSPPLKHPYEEAKRLVKRFNKSSRLDTLIRKSCGDRGINPPGKKLTAKDVDSFWEWLVSRISRKTLREVIKIPPRKTGSTLYAAPRLDIIPESLDEGEDDFSHRVDINQEELENETTDISFDPVDKKDVYSHWVDIDEEELDEETADISSNTMDNKERDNVEHDGPKTALESKTITEDKSGPHLESNNNSKDGKPAEVAARDSGEADAVLNINLSINIRGSSVAHLLQHADVDVIQQGATAAGGQPRLPATRILGMVKGAAVAVKNGLWVARSPRTVIRAGSLSRSMSTEEALQPTVAL